MTEESADTTVTGDRRASRFRTKHLVLLVLVCAVLTWAGWRIWDDLTVDDATRLLRQTLQQLQSNDASERWRAARSLQTVSQASQIEPVVGSLIRALGDRDVEVRCVTAECLGALIFSLQTSADDRIVGDPKVIERWATAATAALRQSMADSDATVRVAAIQGFETLSKQPSSVSNGASPGGASSPGGIAPPARKAAYRPPPELATALQNGEAKWSRANALAYYGYVDRVPPPELLSALKDQSAEVRVAAVRALANFPLNLDSAIPVLLSVLEKDEPKVRDACADTLGAAWPTSTVIPVLSEALRNGKDKARPIAALLLGRTGPEAISAVPALIAILKTPLDPAISRSALGQMQQDAPCSAARALGLISSSDEVITALTATLKSDLDYRHGAAAYGLAQIGDRARVAAPALVDAYKKWQDSKNRAISGHWMTIALGRLAPNSAAQADAVQALVRALDDKDASIRAQAAESLGKFGKNAAAAIPKLQNLKDSPGPRQVRHAASTALDAIQATAKTPAGEKTKS